MRRKSQSLRPSWLAKTFLSIATLLFFCGGSLLRAQSCPGTPGVYFVQCETANVGTGQVLTKAFDGPGALSRTVLIGLNIIQSLGNTANDVTVTDQDFNIYTKRICVDGGSGNATDCVFEAHETTTDTLNVTATIIAGGNPATDHNIHMVMQEYQNLAPFSNVYSAFVNLGSTVTVTVPSPGIAANSFYFILGGWQGFSSVTTWNAPAGYTQEALSNANPGGALGFGSLASFDNFIAAVQPTYGVTLTINVTGGFDPTANLQALLLTYGVSAPGGRRKQGHVE
jgi:hypothetical protein